MQPNYGEITCDRSLVDGLTQHWRANLIEPLFSKGDVLFLESLAGIEFHPIPENFTFLWNLRVSRLSFIAI